jgi:hypothetical protein
MYRLSGDPDQDCLYADPAADTSEVSMRSHPCTSTAALTLLLLVIACSDTSGPESVGSIRITAPHTELSVGGSIQLQATLLNETGAVMAGGQVTWQSSAEAVATVNTSGLVSARGAGVTTITARSGGRSDQISIRVVPPACTSATGGAIAPGQTRTGTLGDSDCLLPHGGPGQGWRVDFAVPLNIRVDLTTSTFVPLILITDLQMNVLHWAYGVEHAQLNVPLGTGSYILWASSDDLSLGSFELSLEQGPPTCTAATQGSIATGQSVTGSMGTTDCLFHDFPAQGWRVDLDSLTRLRIDLTSSAFDAAIVVTDLSLNILAFDIDGGADRNARLVSAFPAGSYIVWAVAVEGHTGPFQLSLELAEPYSCANPASAVSLGQSISGSLTATDCVLDSGAFGDAFTVTLTDAASVRIDLTSSQFDTFLILSNSAGHEIAFDDDGGDNFNSRLNVSLPAGQYTIWASSYSTGATGSYQLAVQPTTAGSAGAGPATVRDAADKLLRSLGKRRQARAGRVQSP